MKFIQISENVLINPEKISSIEYRWTEIGKETIITVEGKEFTADRNSLNLMQDLISSGIETGQKNYQFWAG